MSVQLEDLEDRQHNTATPIYTQLIAADILNILQLMRYNP
jgi:hypothetical protein